MKHRKTARGNSRDLGIPGANGKGSADRVTDTSAYAANYDEIDWGHGKRVVFAETDGEWSFTESGDGWPSSAPRTNDIDPE